MAIMTEEASQLEQSGTNVTFNDRRLHVNVSIRLVGDGKISKLLHGAGGAYCDLFHFSQTECHDVENLQTFFITRSFDKHLAIFNLVAPDGVVQKKPSDDSTRWGMTRKPISHQNVMCGRPLHYLLRSFDWLKKLAIHLIANHLEWNAPSTGDIAGLIKLAKESLKNAIKGKSFVNIDTTSGSVSGSSTVGDMGRVLLWNANKRQYFTDAVPIAYRIHFSILCRRIGMILRIVNSAEKIHVLEFRCLCIKTYTFILKRFPWAQISPTVHQAIGHSWELIALNDFHGLSMLSDAGIEALNKVLRYVKKNLVRKIADAENITDALNRLWAMSSPVFVDRYYKALPYCKKCNTHGHGTRFCGYSKSVSHSQHIDDTFVSEFFDPSDSKENILDLYADIGRYSQFLSFF
jgi:hypothetical protein